jgi:hypothetical protein
LCKFQTSLSTSASLTEISYELLQWEQLQKQKRGIPSKRELEWATVSREIALLNKPYSRT